MIESKKVSVVIPAYNAQLYLHETLQSVRDQTYPNFEVIVVDDGSIDGTSRIAQKFVEDDSRFRHLKQQNKGVSVARNVGFNLSNGDYIAFLDADDVWLPNNLELKVSLLNESDYGLVHSSGVVIKADSTPTSKQLTGAEGNLLDYMLRWCGTSVPGPSSILVDRKTIEKAGLFDERLSTSADHDFFLRVAKVCKIGKVPQVTWKYRLHANNMHKNIARMEKDILLVYKKANLNGLFRSVGFERTCRSNMLLILAASWAGDGGNFLKGSIFFFRALLTHPGSLSMIVKRLYRKWKKD